VELLLFVINVDTGGIRRHELLKPSIKPRVMREDGKSWDLSGCVGVVLVL